MRYEPLPAKVPMIWVTLVIALMCLGAMLYLWFEYSSQQSLYVEADQSVVRILAAEGLVKRGPDRCIIHNRKYLARPLGSACPVYL